MHLFTGSILVWIYKRNGVPAIFSVAPVVFLIFHSFVTETIFIRFNRNAYFNKRYVGLGAGTKLGLCLQPCRYVVEVTNNK